MQYRKDIDGLRALAVIAVVLFHFDIKDLARGGFVGVDIFFVISGFLITKIIYNDLAKTFYNFYNRRIRRIFPALFCLYFFVLLYALPVPLSSDVSFINNGLLASLFFSSNIYFYTLGGYFGPELEQNPLLHTWSLSVEEQFYIFFPVILLILYKVGTFHGRFNAAYNDSQFDFRYMDFKYR